MILSTDLHVHCRLLVWSSRRKLLPGEPERLPWTCTRVFDASLLALSPGRLLGNRSMLEPGCWGFFFFLKRQVGVGINPPAHGSGSMSACPIKANQATTLLQRVHGGRVHGGSAAPDNTAQMCEKSQKSRVV